MKTYRLYDEGCHQTLEPPELETLAGLIAVLRALSIAAHDRSTYPLNPPISRSLARLGCELAHSAADLDRELQNLCRTTNNPEHVR